MIRMMHMIRKTANHMIRISRMIRITANHMIRKKSYDSQNCESHANHIQLSIAVGTEIFNDKIIPNNLTLMIVDIFHFLLFCFCENILVK